MTDIGIDLNEIGYSFMDVIFYIYFLGIFAIGIVFFRNRRDAKQWFPAKK
jgi:Na+/proline symporter